MINLPPPIHPQWSVNHSQRKRAKSPTPCTPRLPPHTPRETLHRNNHLLILHLHQLTTDASLCKVVKSLLEVFQTLPKFTLNLKQNASYFTIRFQSSVPRALFAKSLTSHLQRSQFSLDACIGDVQNNRLQLRKALCLLEMNTTTEQNEDGREVERLTDIEAAGGTLTQSISTATCGYEAQRSCGRNTGAGSCPVQQINRNPSTHPRHRSILPSASAPPTYPLHLSVSP